MGTLQAALSWARRGFSVFPLREHGKEPVHNAWQTVATRDENVIRALWTDIVLGTEKNYNIGTLCSDMVVVDIDVKEGKDGFNEYAQINGHYDTLVVQTPTGGIHCYFNGPDSSNSPISRSIDIRSHNGYVLAPGSYLPGYGEEIYKVINDRPLAPIPYSVERLLKPPYSRTEIQEGLQLDAKSSIEAAIRFLESAPLAIEGQRGDDTTFITAARLVRELGLSVQTAFSLLRDHWNDRCSPPWDHDTLLRKVENAAEYGTAALGRITAEATFGHLVIPPVPSIFAGTGWGNAVRPGSIRPRPWLVDRMLMTEAVTVLMAAGSAGKSSISLALAAHLAVGADFAGFNVRKSCKTIVYNGEDDVEEQSRRLLAVCMAYGYDFEEVSSKIMLLSPQQVRMDLVANDFRRPVRNDALVSGIINQARDEDVGLLILDPLVKIHKCDESDNVQMDYVMETLTDIAHHAQVAVLALHHTSKGGSSQDGRIGNMDIGRGASAIVNAARIAFTLLNASAQDAEDYGLQPEEQRSWVRMDDAKMNLALSSDRATWFHKEGVKIPSSDIVGVLCHETLEKSHQHIRTRIGKTLIANMTATGSASITMPRVVSVLKAEVALLANKTDQEIKRKVEGLFSTPIEIEGHTLQVQRDLNDKKKESVLLVMK